MYLLSILCCVIELLLLLLLIPVVRGTSLRMAWNWAFAAWFGLLVVDLMRVLPGFNGALNSGLPDYLIAILMLSPLVYL